MGYLNQFPNTHYYDEDFGFLIKAYKDLTDKYNELSDIYDFIKNNIKTITIEYLNELFENGEITLDTRYFEDEQRLKFIFDKDTTKTLFQYAVTRFDCQNHTFTQLIGDAIKNIAFEESKGIVTLYEPVQTIANIKVTFPESSELVSVLKVIESEPTNNYIKKFSFEVYNENGIVSTDQIIENGYVEILIGGELK